MSLTIASLVVAILSFIAKITGVELPFTDAEIQSTVVNIIFFVSAIGAWIGRIRLGDLNIFGIRTK